MQQFGLKRVAAKLAFLILGALALLAFGGDAAFAQVTGKVIGTVTDEDTGEPLAGAQIVVEGTNLGNVSNEDGYFFINNVPVGVQRITTQYLGYQTTTSEQRVLAGQTMTVDFALSSEVVQVEDIVTTVDTEPLVARDNTISKSRFTAEDIQGLPVESLGEIVELGAGVYVDDDIGGFVIRGGRSSESATYVDGVLINDFSTQRTNTRVASFGVEEIDVITGGFNAEFGNAQSGVINIVTREGGREYHGNVRFTTDGQFGTDGYTLDELGLDFDETALRFDRVGAPEEETCCGYNGIQASIGGPIIPEKLTFFGSLEAEGAADIGPAVAGFNPADGAFNSSGSTNTILPGNRGDRTRAQAKLTSFITESSKLTGTYLYSRDQLEGFDDATTAATIPGLFQVLTTGSRTKTHDFIVGYDQQIFQTAERSLNLQVRGNFHQTKLFIGTPLNAISAAFLLGPAGITDEECGESCDQALDVGDAFEDDFLNYRFDDVEFFFEDAVPADVRLSGIPTLLAVEPDPVFGLSRIFGSQGFTDSFRKRDERRYGLRVDLDGQLNRVHRVKVGGEYTWINLADRGPLFASATFADFYDVDPRVAALYAQDRLDYGDLVIDLGLRVDHWDPNQDFPRFPGIVPCSISAFDQCSDETLPEITGLVEGQTRTELSPRLGVAHPITDATQVRLSYGKFHQLPELRHYFDGFTTDFVAAAQNPNILYGNPNLDYVETTAFEAGITHLLSEDLVLDLVGYNRDRRGAIRVDVFQPQTLASGVDERRIYVNGDNGNVKGFDISVNKRYSNYFSADMAWSLQWARGTTSDPLDFAAGGGFGRLFDPLFPGRLLVPPSELAPDDYDRLHSINTQFTVRFPDDYREGTMLGTALQDFGIYLIYNAHSGEPFTRRSNIGQGEPLEDFNRSRLPWFHQGDLRVTKGLDLGGALDLELFATVINVLDIENVVQVNQTTGLPDASGFEDQASATPVIPTDLFIEDAPTTFPVDVTNIVAEFRDEVRLQDLDGNGTITLEESRAVAREAERAAGDQASFTTGDVGDSPFNYGEPRQYRFGAEIRF